MPPSIFSKTKLFRDDRLSYRPSHPGYGRTHSRRPSDQRADGLATRQSAIDRDHCTGHVIGQVGRKEFDDLGAILDRSETP